MRTARFLRIGGAATLLAVLALAMTLVIHSSSQGAHAAAPSFTHTYGPIAVTGDQDSGTCGNNWAVDSFSRVFTVNSKDTVVFNEAFTKGHFVTVAGQSPEACASGTDNGNTVGDGVKGHFSGEYFHVAVSGGTFDASAKCGTPGDSTCDTTQEFVNTVWGPDATYNVTSYDFDYSTTENGADTQDSSDLGGYYGDITGPLVGSSHSTQYRSTPQL